MEITRTLSIVAFFLVFYLCIVQTQAFQEEQTGFDSESFNTKWTAIRTWMNSTKLATTTSNVSPRIKLLCTNKFIDLIVVMCKQYLSRDVPIDSILGEDADVSHEETPRLRHAHHWNMTNLATTSKKLRNFLRKTLPATSIHECCSESCNVTTLLKYCPGEPRPKPIFVRSNNVIIGTLTVMHPHNHKHPSHNHGNSNVTLARLRHNYDVWRARTYRQPANNIDFAPVHLATASSTFNYEPDLSDELSPGESSNASGRGAREERNHQSTEASVSTTTKNPRDKSINGYNHTPEPYTFDLRSSDILYRP